MKQLFSLYDQKATYNQISKEQENHKKRDEKAAAKSLASSDLDLKLPNFEKLPVKNVCKVSKKPVVEDDLSIIKKGLMKQETQAASTTNLCFNLPAQNSTEST